MSSSPAGKPTEPTGAPPEGRRRSGPLRKENRRLVAGLVLGALVAAFAVVNTENVQVDWVITSSRTPLIVVIAVAFALGLLIGWLVGAMRRART